MLPTAKTLNPEARRSESMRVVVVDLPLVPVTPTRGWSGAERLGEVVMLLWSLSRRRCHWKSARGAEERNAGLYHEIGSSNNLGRRSTGFCAVGPASPLRLRAPSTAGSCLALRSGRT